jgi:hypothetical protein
MTYRDDSLGMPPYEASCYPHAFWTLNSEDNATEIKKDSDKYTDNDTISNNICPQVATGLICRTAS